MKGNLDAERDQHHGTTQGEAEPACRGEGVRSKITRPAWLSWFTQRGSDPPFMLKYRSSDGFIIGTVALAVFTVWLSAYDDSNGNMADSGRTCSCMAL